MKGTGGGEWSGVMRYQMMHDIEFTYAWFRMWKCWIE